MNQFLLGCAVVTAMLGTLAGLGKAGLWLWRVLRNLARLADDLTGEPPRPGMPEGRPGLLDRLGGIEDTLQQVTPRLDGLEARLDRLEAQMHPNGGSTLRDAVDRLAPAEPAP